MVPALLPQYPQKLQRRKGTEIHTQLPLHVLVIINNIDVLLYCCIVVVAAMIQETCVRIISKSHTQHVGHQGTWHDNRRMWKDQPDNQPSPDPQPAALVTEP